MRRRNERAGNRDSDKGCGVRGRGREIAGERASVCTRVLVHGGGGTRACEGTFDRSQRDVFAPFHPSRLPFLTLPPSTAVDGLVNGEPAIRASRVRMRSRNNFGERAIGLHAFMRGGRGGGEKTRRSASRSKESVGADAVLRVILDVVANSRGDR